MTLLGEPRTFVLYLNKMCGLVPFLDVHSFPFSSLLAA